MDKCIEWYRENQIDRTVNHLAKNNMFACYVRDERALLEKIRELVKENSLVAVGDSMTLFETGVYLRKAKVRFFWINTGKESPGTRRIKCIEKAFTPILFYAAPMR